MKNNILKTFLICHRGALGDFILIWPAVRLLRTHFPEYRFIGLGRPDYMKLAVRLGILEEFHDSESADMVAFFENGIIPERLGKPGKGVLWLKDSGKTSYLLKRNSGCEFSPIEPFPGDKMHVANYHIHEVSRNFNFTEKTNPVSLTPEFHFPPKSKILIHPGSGSPAKNYSPEFYLKIAELAEAALKKNVKFVLGPVEIERGIGRFFPAEKTIVPESASALAEILGGAPLYVGNDSGASHLSGILGVPTVVLYRNTDPAKWGAVGRKVKCFSGTDEKALLKNLMDFFVSREQF